MPVREGGYAVEFPDIPEAFTQGENLEECMVMGAEVLAIAVEEYAKARKELPTPSNLDEVEAWAETQKNDPSLATSKKFLFQLFPCTG